MTPNIYQSSPPLLLSHDPLLQTKGEQRERKRPEREDGTLNLAVIGKEEEERIVRTTTCHRRLTTLFKLSFLVLSLISASSCCSYLMKLRSGREVFDWLTHNVVFFPVVLDVSSEEKKKEIF